jgi:hypothetical protein
MTLPAGTLQHSNSGVYSSVDRIKHPDYTARSLEWEKYRLTFEGGREYVERYLSKFSTREAKEDFEKRKNITYCPAHAKAAIIDVRNSIYQRMVDINRKHGPTSYIKAVQGVAGGVDLRGNTMDAFIGRMILPELLILGRVGVFVDKPAMGAYHTKKQSDALTPYLYYYRAEDILSWRLDTDNQLSVLLLRDYDVTIDERTGLPDGDAVKYRLLRRDGDKVVVEFHEQHTNMYDSSYSTRMVEQYVLEIPRIPFVFFDIGQSLLKDVADYQAALLNLSSSDLIYVLKSNLPFYTEQYNPNTTSPHIEYGNDRPIAETISDTACATDACPPVAKQINIGVNDGRAYPKGTDRPQFIHPSPEPLQVSMAKQEQLKTEIRQLVNLAITNIAPVRASAESKDKDDKGLEAGLSYIGLELEHGEREIGKIWALYENATAPTIKYPNSYSLRSDSERRQEAKELRDLMPTVPSKRFQRVLAKDIARIVVGGKVSDAEMKDIESEIDKAEVVVSDPETVRKDHEAGFVGTNLASKIRGYPEGEVEKAKQDHAERLALIQAAQTPADTAGSLGARGVADQSVNAAEEARNEKLISRIKDDKPTTEDRVRGKGKDNNES